MLSSYTPVATLAHLGSDPGPKLLRGHPRPHRPARRAGGVSYICGGGNLFVYESSSPEPTRPPQ